MFRVRTVFTGVTGTPWVSNHYYDGAGDTTPSEMRARTVAFWNAFAPIISNQITRVTEGEILEMSPATGEPIGSTVVVATPAQGAATGEPLPWATQAYINWNTGVFVDGRRIRGRTFIPGLTEAANTTGSGPNASVLDAAEDAVAAIVGTSSAGFGVWSKKNNVFVEATGGDLSARWGVLRSRKD